ncbi:MAG TPA: alpha/beta hydrolase [Burkholderiaceae bacterium]|nr:alpha/beta hydrolase [Burkholderiaceae bacterium]
MTVTDGGREIARTLVRDDVRLGYRITRARFAPAAGAIVLLHGLASNLTRWSEFVATTRLVDRWDLIRVDLRGHGGSLTRRTISLEQWRDDTVAILAAEGHTDAVWVGHSLGAQVALHAAATRPRAARALALIDPLFQTALHGKWARIARLRPLLAAVASLTRALNAMGLHRRALPPLDLRVLDEEARRALGSAAAEAEFVRRYSSTTADLRHVPLAVYLQDLVELFRAAPSPATIACPVLALLSRGGTFADFADTASIARGFPQGREVVVDCQHWPLTERPAEVRGAIETWCDELDSAPRADDRNS